MENSKFQLNLVGHIEQTLNIKIVSISKPPQGMTSEVFFITTVDQKEYAIKYGKDAMKDVPAIELIVKNHINIPVPKLIASFLFEGIPVIILEKISFPLFDSLEKKDMARYIKSMIDNLRELHKIKSLNPKLVAENTHYDSWKNMMLSIFNGGSMNWEEIAKRASLDSALILRSVENITIQIKKTNFNEEEFSFLHTDFNQRNLFINPDTNDITGIIDWEEAMFGDPIFDFARVRMLIWHFDLGNEVLNDYYHYMQYSKEERKLDDLYFLIRVIQYLGWYSSEVNAFNTGRIKLHQNYLNSYIWNNK